MRFTLFALVMGCAPAKGASMHFTSFGELAPGRDEQIEEAFRAARDTPAPGVRVLSDTLPPGIELDGDVYHVSEGYSHQITGKFELTYTVTAAKAEDLLRDLQAIGASAGGDLVIAHLRSQGKVYYIGATGIVVKEGTRSTAEEGP